MMIFWWAFVLAMRGARAIDEPPADPPPRGAA
jgi:hypothetical protein